MFCSIKIWLISHLHLHMATQITKARNDEGSVMMHIKPKIGPSMM